MMKLWISRSMSEELRDVDNAKTSCTLLVTCNIPSPDRIQHSFTLKELIEPERLDN